MSIYNRNKLNQLINQWPSGTVFTTSWLNEHGISCTLINRYKTSKWIESIGQGAVKRFGDKVEWPGAIYALQKQLGKEIHIGGKTVIQQRGYGRNLPLKRESIYLFAKPGVKFPKWFKGRDWGVNVNFLTTGIFSNTNIGLEEKSFGSFSILVSTIERAMLENVSLIPQRQSYEESLYIMENLARLRPTLVQGLLENCHSIKTKRLFMHLAEKTNHKWLTRIVPSKIDFGKGKRTIVKGGVFDQKYNITIPDTRPI